MRLNGQKKLRKTETNNVTFNCMPYSAISLIYKDLMKEVDYEGWANYIADAIRGLIPSDSKAVELAAGMCNLSVYFSKRIKDLTLTDISWQMLKNAESKSFRRICCDMKKLPFKQNFDFALCAFDSVNYLITEEDFLSFLKEVYNTLTPNGVFAFDASLEKNSLKAEIYLNRSGSINGIKYEQKSYYDNKSKLHFNIFKIVNKRREEYIEVHKQKIYPLEFYFQNLEDCGFYVVNCFECFTFNDAKPNSKRAQFIVKKIK